MRTIRSVVALSLAAAIAACSGGGGGGTDAGGGDGGNPPPVTYGISGTITGATGVTVTLRSSAGTVVATQDTGATSAYAFTGLSSGRYTVTPAKTGYTFTLASEVVEVSGANVTGKNFHAHATAAAYTISGDAGTTDVTITISSDAGTVARFVANGAYTSPELASSVAYTVTPARTGYTFDPPSRPVAAMTTDVTGVSFTADVTRYTVSGTVAAEAGEVVITVDELGAFVGTFAASGSYTSSPILLHGHGYTLTPTKTGWNFSPPSHSVPNVGADVTGKDFGAALKTYTASGAITGGATGVTVTVTADAADGEFVTSFVASGSSYTTPRVLVHGRTYFVTASKEGWVFDPPNRPIVSAVSDFTGLDFDARLDTYTVRGNVGGTMGVTMTITDVTADPDALVTSFVAGGVYASPDVLVHGRSYVLTPTKTGWHFDPPSADLTDVRGDLAGRDFGGALNTYRVSGNVFGGATGVTMTLTDVTDAEFAVTTFVASGAYASPAVLVHGRSYRLSPSKTGWHFFAESLTFTNVTGDVTLQNFAGELDTYAVSGAVTGASDVTMTLTDVTADPDVVVTTFLASGPYETSDVLVHGRSYVLTPTKTGWHFDPPNEQLTNVTSDLSGKSFAGERNRYTVSGRVFGATDVEMRITELDGDFVTSFVASGAGALYTSPQALVDGSSYVLTPVKTGWHFGPAATLQLTNVTGNLADRNFAGELDTYAVEGDVTGGATGVTMTITDVAPEPDAVVTTFVASGPYRSPQVLVHGSSYVIAPSKLGWRFTPESESLPTVMGDVAGKDFAGAQASYTVSGAVPLEAGEVTITVTDGGGALVGSFTASGGAYTSDPILLHGGTYTLTPSKDGWEFTPPSAQLTNVTGDLTLPSFSGDVARYAVSGVVVGDVDAVEMTITDATDGEFVASFTATGSYTSPDVLVHGGSYVLTPSKEGWQFVPDSAPLLVVVADVTNQFFFGQVETYTVSGEIAGGATDVTMTLTDATDGEFAGSFVATGSYVSPPVLEHGTAYVLTPSKLGWRFTPGSVPLGVASADVTGVHFDGEEAWYTLSGTVSGASDVTITVTDSDGTVVASLAADDAYVTGAVLGHGGTYTVTPSKPDYIFSPDRVELRAVDADAIDVDFAGEPAAGAVRDVSGTITGPWVEGVEVVLSGDGVDTTYLTTTAGTYRFDDVPVGSYTVTARLTGYVFAGPGGFTGPQHVQLAGSDVVLDLVQRSAVPSFSISGSVSYAGAEPGDRIYVGARPSWCGGDCGGHTVSLVVGDDPEAPMEYEIHGLGGGQHVVQAWLDSNDTGVRNATNPSAQPEPFHLTTSVSGADLTLEDPDPIAPQAPAEVEAVAANGSALVEWEPVWDTSTRREAATAYRVWWGTNPDATVGGGVSARIPARDDTHYVVSGLTDTQQYYFKVTSLVGDDESAPSPVFGPVRIGGAAPGTGNTVFGEVTFPGTATGALLVALEPADGPMHLLRVAPPLSSPQGYSLAGVPDGTHGMYFILDRNDSGTVDQGDLTAPAAVTFTGTGTSTRVDVTLEDVAATWRLRTNHRKSGQSEWYNVMLNVESGTKRVVSARVVSGPNVPLPHDLIHEWDFRMYAYTWGARPAVGDEYQFVIRYSDGSEERRTASVSGVVDAFATNLRVQTTAPGSPTAPLLEWDAPTNPPPPAGHTYQVELSGPNAWWSYPDNDDFGMPGSQTEVVYSGDPLVPGSTYQWRVKVLDQNGNETQVDAPEPFTVPELLTGYFVDAPVAGMTYTTESRQDVTGPNGEFTYLPGETVTFSIGALAFPTVSARPLVTPLTMAGTSNLDDPIAINVSRLLVSLDADADPANGIAIPAAAADAASEVNFDLPTGTFAAQPSVTFLVANSGSPTTTLVDAATARAHLEANMLAGTWRSPLAGVLVLLDGGGWFFAEGTGGADWNGADGGTWVYDPELGEITFTVTFDGSFDSGIGDVPGSTTSAAVEIVDGNLVFDGVLPFAREPYGTGLAGTWSQPDEELGGFVFFADGTFVYVEAGGEPTNGLEAGTYTFSGGVVGLTLTYSDNTNGGIDDVPGTDPGAGPDVYSFPAVVSGDTLTISVPNPPDPEPFQLVIYRY